MIVKFDGGDTAVFTSRMLPVAGSGVFVSQVMVMGVRSRKLIYVPAVAGKVNWKADTM